MKLLLVLLALFALGNASDWGYPDLDVNQDEPFPHWGGECDNGKYQSPINLNTKGELKGEFDELEFSDYDDKQNNVVITNNGHSVQLSQFEHEMVLQGGPLRDDYVVEQIHLHWWSEHTINDIRYPLEVHIVHRNQRYANMTEAAKHSDGVTVIGVLYHVSNTRNEAIDKVLNNLDDVKSYKNVNKPSHLSEPFVVSELFSDISGYFNYAGSLTTPTCGEVVTWLVLANTHPVTLEQVEKFRELEYAEGKQLHNNYRTIQPLHNRAVVIVTPRKGGASTPIALSLTGTLLFVCLSKFLQ